MDDRTTTTTNKIREQLLKSRKKERLWLAQQLTHFSVVTWLLVELKLIRIVTSISLEWMSETIGRCLIENKFSYHFFSAIASNLSDLRVMWIICVCVCVLIQFIYSFELPLRFANLMKSMRLFSTPYANLLQMTCSVGLTLPFPLAVALNSI